MIFNVCEGILEILKAAGVFTLFLPNGVKG
jgi:hypothetical protein